LGGISLDAFEQDWESAGSSSAEFEIISEASRRLPDEIKKRRPAIPWAKVAGCESALNFDPIQIDM